MLHKILKDATLAFHAYNGGKAKRIVQRFLEGPPPADLEQISKDLPDVNLETIPTELLMEVLGLLYYRRASIPGFVRFANRAWRHVTIDQGEVKYSDAISFYCSNGAPFDTSH